MIFAKIGITCIVIGAIWSCIWFRKELRKMDRLGPVYRDVVSYDTADNQEVAHLSCGHSIILQRFRRKSLPCQNCADRGGSAG